MGIANIQAPEIWVECPPSISDNDTVSAEVIFPNQRLLLAFLNYVLLVLASGWIQHFRNFTSTLIDMSTWSVATNVLAIFESR